MTNKKFRELGERIAFLVSQLRAFEWDCSQRHRGVDTNKVDWPNLRSALSGHREYMDNEFSILNQKLNAMADYLDVEFEFTPTISTLSPAHWRVVKPPKPVKK